MPSVSLYSITAPVFERHLTALSGTLDKAQAFIEQQKIPDAQLLQTRVFPNMFTFAQQVTFCTDHSTRCVGMIAGIALPQFPGNEATIADLKARIAQAIEYVQGIKPDQINGKEDIDVTLKFSSGERTWKGEDFAMGFSIPNYFFHHATAHGILRGMGVDIGKGNYMGTKVAR